MIYKFVLIVLLLALGQFAFSQSNLPVVRASSKAVDIMDGNHFKKGHWYIFPDRRPDYYYVEIPEKPHKVTFTTDMGSISFDTKYGKDYDFIVLLNGKDSCYTRITARYKTLHPYMRKRAVPGPDTIPFTVGDNDKIYLKATVNGSQPLDIQFDLGAGGTIIKKSSVEKVKMKFDGTLALHNSDGTNQVPSASSNLLEMGNLVWDSVGIVVADNMTYREDLLIGNSLFKNKVVEIDYDQKIFVVHDSLPALAAGYSQHDIILDGGTIPYIEGSLTVHGKTQMAWMMLDVGAHTSILNSEDVSMTDRILGESKRMIGMDSNASVPKLNIGSYEFSRFNYKTRKMGKDGLHLILGNDLLKRFNLILDNRNGKIYLKPNSLAAEPYRKTDEYFMVRIAAGLLILMTGMLVYWRRRKKRKNNRA